MDAREWANALAGQANKLSIEQSNEVSQILTTLADQDDELDSLKELNRELLDTLKMLTAYVPIPADSNPFPLPEHLVKARAVIAKAGGAA